MKPCSGDRTLLSRLGLVFESMNGGYGLTDYLCDLESIMYKPHNT